MIRILGAVLIWCFLAAFASAQVGQIPAWPPVQFTASAPAYTGPGDIVASADGWWGTRAYSAATAGTKAVNVCNVADVVCADLSTSASTGQLVVSTIGGSSCAIVTCTIKTYYDQSGGGQCGGPCDMTQATIANRAVFSTSCLSSLPCGAFSNTTNTFYINSGYTNAYAAGTVSCVVERTSVTSFSGIFFSHMGQIQLGFSNSADTLYAQAGSFQTQSATDNAFHAVQVVYNGASGIFDVDGVSNTVNFGGALFFADLSLSTTGSSYNGNMAECGVWPTAFSAGNNTSMNSNQHTFWGF